MLAPALAATPGISPESVAMDFHEQSLHSRTQATHKIRKITPRMGIYSTVLDALSNPSTLPWMDYPALSSRRYGDRSRW